MKKVLGFMSLRTASKVMAMIAFIVIGIAMYATSSMPDNFVDNEEWKIWRKADFSVSVVSVLFASCLLYGSISEFRLFVFLWISWNVILIVFWIAFLVRKHDQFESWERVFRIIAIILMAYAEIPVCSYYRFMKDRIEDPESPKTWIPNEYDQAYKTLCDQSSNASLNSVFKTSIAAENAGFQEESNLQSRASTCSDASEGIEMKERENEPESEARSPNDLETNATVHAYKPEGSVSVEFSELPVDMIEVSRNDPTHQPTAAPSQDSEVLMRKVSDRETSIFSSEDRLDSTPLADFPAASAAAEEADQANGDSSQEVDGSIVGSSSDEDTETQNETDLATCPPAPAISETLIETEKL